MPTPPLRLNVLAAVTLKASVLVPPCKVAKPLKSNVFVPSLYVGLPSSAHVLASFSPVSVPPAPVRVPIPSKPPGPVILSSVPVKPFPSDPVNTTASIRSPCNISTSVSPSIEPVSAASISKVSAPSPPLRMNALAVETLNASVLVPPCKVAKPLKFSVWALSLYVGPTPSAQVLAAFSPVSIVPPAPVPVRVPIPSKSSVISASVPAKPSVSEPVNTTAVIASPCNISTPASPSIEPVSVAPMSKVSTPEPPLRSNSLAVETLNASVFEPPWSVSNAENAFVLYVGVAPKAHVEDTSRPVSVSVPPPPVSVVIALISASRLTVSSPNSPSIAPVSWALMLKVSTPSPPLRSNSLAVATVNASVLDPP